MLNGWNCASPWENTFWLRVPFHGQNIVYLFWLLFRFNGPMSRTTVPNDANEHNHPALQPVQIIQLYSTGQSSSSTVGADLSRPQPIYRPSVDLPLSE